MSCVFKILPYTGTTIKMGKRHERLCNTYFGGHSSVATAVMNKNFQHLWNYLRHIELKKSREWVMILQEANGNLLKCPAHDELSTEFKKK